MTGHREPQKTTARKMVFQRTAPKPCMVPQTQAQGQEIVRRLGQKSRVPMPVKSCSWCLKWSLSPTLLRLHPFVKHGSITENNP